MVGPRSVQCCSGRGICAGNPVLPLDQSNPDRTRTNPEHCRGSIETGSRRASRTCDSLRTQRPTPDDINRSGGAMKHPSIKCLLSLPRERNQNCEEPVKGRARWHGSLRSPLTEPSQFQSTPPLWKRKKKIERSVVSQLSTQRSHHVSPIPTL